MSATTLTIPVPLDLLKGMQGVLQWAMDEADTSAGYCNEEDAESLRETSDGFLETYKEIEALIVQHAPKESKELGR